MNQVKWNIIEGEGHFHKSVEILEGDPCKECGRPRHRKTEWKLKDDLFTDFAKSVADASRAGRLSTSQLRNFYDAIKTTEGRLIQEADPETRAGMFDIEKSRLKLLFAKIHYARSNGRIPPVFATFMEKCLKIVTNEDAKYRDFEAFVLTFEAVAGYFGKG
ncbi:type III-A CRISPR-associated protein Csm2 [Candidatus Poribacteria bacterium]|nr:type III-A CRISPR-associated protein Csm2 [Candidatus Poribacteria bacterium]